MSNLQGVIAELFYQTDGVSGSAGWVENVNMRDATIDLSKVRADNTVRANNGWGSEIGTIKRCEVTFQMRTDHADANYLVFLNAWMTDTHLGLRAYDGADSGIEADFHVMDFRQAQEIEGVQMTDVICSLTFIDTAPVYNLA